MTAHRHELPQPWSTAAKVVAFPVGLCLLTIWTVGLLIVKTMEAPFRLARWISDGRPGWDDAVGGPAIDDDGSEDEWQS